MTTPEPLLEMTEDDEKCLRLGYALAAQNPLAKEVAEQFGEILLRVEAGRRKAEFWRYHRFTKEHVDLDADPPDEFCYACKEIHFKRPDWASTVPQLDPRHNWTPADWLAEVEREVKA